MSAWGKRDAPSPGLFTKQQGETHGRRIHQKGDEQGSRPRWPVRARRPGLTWGGLATEGSRARRGARRNALCMIVIRRHDRSRDGAGPARCGDRLRPKAYAAIPFCAAGVPLRRRFPACPQSGQQPGMLTLRAGCGSMRGNRDCRPRDSIAFFPQAISEPSITVPGATGESALWAGPTLRGNGPGGEWAAMTRVKMARRAESGSGNRRRKVALNQQSRSRNALHDSWSLLPTAA